MDHLNPLFSPMPVLRLGATAPNRAQPRVTAPNRAQPRVTAPNLVLHFTITVADAERFWAARPHLKAALETVTREIRSGNSRLL
jgi:hypothetical protein